MTKPVSTPVKDTSAMISGMAPVLDDPLYHFCLLPDGTEALKSQALASFAEDEGLSVILTDQVARAAALASDLPMRRITLTVHSALDGVGLTQRSRALWLTRALPATWLRPITMIMPLCPPLTRIALWQFYRRSRAQSEGTHR